MRGISAFAAAAAVLWCSIAAGQRSEPTATRPATGDPQPAPPADPLQQALDPVEVQRMPLRAFLNHMRELAGVTMTIRWVELNRIGVFSDSTVTLSLEGSTIADALREALRQADRDAAGATFVVRGREVIVSSREDLARETEVRVYDISAILNAPLSDEDRLRIEESIAELWKQHYHVFSPPWHRQPRHWAREGRSRALKDRSLTPHQRETRDTIDQIESALSMERANRLKRLIETTIDPQSWREPDLASVTVLDNRLVVRQSPENHNAIVSLLAQLGTHPHSEASFPLPAESGTAPPPPPR